MKKRMHEIVAEVFHDLQAACAEGGERLDAEGLADCLGDRMYDESEEYRALPYEEAHAMTMQVARSYC